MRIGRIAGLLLVSPVLFMTAMTMAGCGGGGDNFAEGPVTVTFWQFWPTATVAPLISEFEAAHPDIKVDMQQLTWASGLEKITAAVAAGNPPDLCELGSTWFAKFAGNGALADLTAEAAPLRDDYLMWEACTYDGKVQGLPWLMGTRTLFYNRALFRGAGLDPDRAPETWVDLLTAVTLIHDPDRRVFGYGLNSGERYVQFKKFMPFAWGNGARVLSEDRRSCVVDADATREALEFYLRLKPVSLLEKQEVLDQAFKDGRLGAMISGAWMLRTIPRDAPDLDFGVALVPRPAADRGTHASFGGGEILVSFARAKQREAALTLARFLMEAPQAMAIARVEQSVLPAARGAETDPFFAENPMQGVFLDQLRTSVFPPSHVDWVEIEDVLDQWVEKAVYGQTPPAEALSQACRGIDAILARSAR